MITPCIKICKLSKGRCAGCGRTADQIAQWIYFTDDQRQKIIQELNEKHTGNQCRIP